MGISTSSHRRAAKPAARPIRTRNRGRVTMQERVESESGALIRRCSQLLRERFPVAFGDNAVPLKVGIGKDVHESLEGAFGRKVIEAAIGRHVRTRAYLVGLTEGANRVDLGGRHVGRVSATEFARAKKQLDLMDSCGGAGADSLAKKDRAQLLKRYEASSKPAQEFADLVELDVMDLNQRLERARLEREQRQAEARELVERWRSSGLSRNQFCKAEKIKPRKLETALERMGVVYEAPSTDGRAH